MKKIITTVLTALFLTTSANAFFNNNDMPWNNNYNAQDNGMFAYNSFDYLDPRWFSTEFTNMINEIDDDGDMFGRNNGYNHSNYNFVAEAK